MNVEKLSLVGLGKLGLPLAACYADAGLNVLGVDINEDVVQSINAGGCPIVEPGLADILARHGGSQLVATTDYQRAIEETDITIVLVSTPSEQDGSFSNNNIKTVLTHLGTALKNSAKPNHLFIISSTVMPGSIMVSFIPLLTATTQRELGAGFDICYDPDFVALGNVVNDFRNPDIIVIGESSTEAGQQVVDLHSRLCHNHPHIARMSIPSAEIAKVSLNAYITMKISFANMVANICERIPGGDVDAVTQAIGRDRRIAPYYFRGGLGFGGTCFPRDTRAFTTLSNSVGIAPSLIEAVEVTNALQDQLLYEAVLTQIKELNGDNKVVVGVLGLAFKPDTPVIVASPSITLIQRLIADGIKVVAHDPLAATETAGHFGNQVTIYDNPTKCLIASNICVVCHRTETYKTLIESYQPETHLTVIDPWRLLAPDKIDNKVQLIPFGRYVPNH